MPEPLWTSKEFSLYPDRIVQQPGWTARALSSSSIVSGYVSPVAGVTSPANDRWTLSKDISAFPRYTSPFLMSDALYNMSLEEMQKAIEPDSTFRTGKEWAGVWTRDISYSIILSMAYLQPRVAKNSLLRKVDKNGRIIQDTGTGGAWPVSSDRMIWAVAAWELYKVTGDRDWLQQAYGIIKKSLEDDQLTLYDPLTGMVKGESSFLDWREQTYPAWMQPADIFESENLGTNAVHYQANRVLADMARLLHHDEVAEKHAAIAAKIRAGVNRYLWMPEQGYYGQYLYGRIYKTVSPRSEALGEALSVLFDIAGTEEAKSVIAHTPVMAYGISCIYPQIPGIPPYHNKAVWPFVQTFWMWAAAAVGNEKAVIASIGDIYRPAAFFLTNKENFVAENGDFHGTQINSSNMLWSLSGNLSIVYKVLFGMRFAADHLTFQPFVPRALGGRRTLTNVHYRGAVLNIFMDGFGNEIRSFLVDGKVWTQPVLPDSLTGIHEVRIELADNMLLDAPVHTVPDYTSPAAPVAGLSGDTLSWQPVEGAVKYRLYGNGNLLLETSDTHVRILPSDRSVLYQVAALDAKGVSSFLSEPLSVYPPGTETVYPVEIEISQEKNRQVTIPVTAQEPGRYAIDFRYSNGNGPVNTENKCAIRNLLVDGHLAGAMVFPQRGKDQWSNWGYSNALILELSAGVHTVVLSFDGNDENMNGAINQAKLDGMRVIRLGVQP